VKRRAFITLLGGAAAWPLAARAQQPAMPVVGFLSSGAEQAFAPNVAGFLRGLREAGYIQGQNVAIEYRWANSHYDRLSAMATELVRRRVTVLVASGGTAVARAAKEATRRYQSCFRLQMIQLLTGSSAASSGNITGVALLSTELAGKRLGLIRELVPHTRTVALLINADNPESATITKDAQEAANAISVKMLVLNAKTEHDIDLAFKTIAQERADVLIVGTDPLYYIRRDQLIALAASNAVPTIYFLREFVAAGGLMSYGTNFADAYRQLGAYAGRILKGEKPNDLPVLQPTKFELVINATTAKALRLTIPSGVLAIADEVIE
jgi:putative ABC transport system substrate-binding protein